MLEAEVLAPTIVEVVFLPNHKTKVSTVVPTGAMAMQKFLIPARRQSW